MYRGGFLEGFSLRDSGAFEEWTLIKQAQIAQQYLDALRYLVTAYEQGGGYEQAQAFARRQKARSLELRATTCLARLWQEQDRMEKAYQVLGRINGWFTEGFDTPDLNEAKTLLEELS